MTQPAATVVAASPFCFGGFNPFVAYAAFARAGLRYVEVPALPAGLAMKHDLTTFVPEYLGDGDVRAMRERLAGMGLTPITVAAFCDLLEPGQDEALRRRIDFARRLGASYVLTDATGRADLGGRPRQLVNSLRCLADYAEDRGVRIALEIHEGPTRNGKLAAEFLDRVDHPNVGVNYDTGNVYYYNDGIDPAEDIHHVAGRVVHVHLKDTTGGKGEWQFCALGDGRVKFPAILQALRSAGFTGPYSLEVEGIAGEDLNREGYVRRLEKSLHYLKQIGLDGV
jgi:sugar phosphate isomerase/epimerase